MSQDIKKLYHPILFPFLKLLVRPVAYFKWGYRYKDKYKIEKGRNVVVVSNHVTDYDPILIHLSLNKLVHCLATDNIFAGTFTARLLRYIGVIPKRKGMVDLRSNMMMFKMINNGDSLLFFPEGNRSYGDFQFYVADNISKLFKNFKVDIVIFNIHGGFGKYPRIGVNKRKGKFYGEIKRILKYEEYKDMDDKELSKIITEGIKVFDSDSEDKYISNKKAEYFERLFFICPKCGAISSIYSEGNYLKCHHCDLKVEYGEDLLFHSDDPTFKFRHIREWYDYQKKYLLKKDFSKEEVIFKDEHVKLFLSNPFQRRITINKNSSMILTNTQLIFDNRKFDLKDIMIASPVSGRKLCFTVEDNNFVVRGKERFNAIKYVLMFNKLDTLMKKEKVDSYYRLED